MHKILVIFSILMVFSSCDSSQTLEDRIIIENARIRELPPGSSVTAGYILIKNNTTYDDTLYKISSDSAEKIEIHTTFSDDSGVVRMRKLDNLVIPSGKTVSLIPGGHHLMLMGIDQDKFSEDIIVLTLFFKEYGELKVDAVIKPIDIDEGSHH